MIHPSWPEQYAPFYAEALDAAFASFRREHPGLPVSQEDILGPSRERHVVMARRHVARVLMARLQSMSHVGRALRRDRTTVWHLLKERTQ